MIKKVALQFILIISCAVMFIACGNSDDDNNKPVKDITLSEARRLYRNAGFMIVSVDNSSFNAISVGLTFGVVTVTITQHINDAAAIKALDEIVIVYIPLPDAQQGIYAVRRGRIIAEAVGVGKIKDAAEVLLR